MQRDAMPDTGAPGRATKNRESELDDLLKLADWTAVLKDTQFNHEWTRMDTNPHE